MCESRRLAGETIYPLCILFSAWLDVANSQLSWTCFAGMHYWIIAVIVSGCQIANELHIVNSDSPSTCSTIFPDTNKGGVTEAIKGVGVYFVG